MPETATTIAVFAEAGHIERFQDIMAKPYEPASDAVKWKRATHVAGFGLSVAAVGTAYSAVAALGIGAAATATAPVLGLSCAIVAAIVMGVAAVESLLSETGDSHPSTESAKALVTRIGSIKMLSEALKKAAQSDSRYKDAADAAQEAEEALQRLSDGTPESRDKDTSDAADALKNLLKKLAELPGKLIGDSEDGSGDDWDPTTGHDNGKNDPLPAGGGGVIKRSAELP